MLVEMTSRREVDVYVFATFWTTSWLRMTEVIEAFTYRATPRNTYPWWDMYTGRELSHNDLYQEADAAFRAREVLAKNA